MKSGNPERLTNIKDNPMKSSLTTLAFIFMLNIVFAQENCSFCKAVGNERFNKVERLIRKEVRKHRDGISFYNGPGSGMLVSHVTGIDSITRWLSGKPCVQAAAWDKCVAKISIYPGGSVIGVIFKTRSGEVEKCFKLQEGTTGTLHIFGWRPQVFRAKNLLLYKKMYDCEGFTIQQIIHCRDLNQKE